MPRFTLLSILLIAIALAGCAYAPPIRQGNYLDEDNVAKVETGMTKAQVQFALGTPMVQDPFHTGRWDYIYYIQPNNGEPIRRKHVVIYFQNDKVSRIVKLDMKTPAEKKQDSVTPVKADVQS
ncbi:MAG TPA: outer membrane protein assembly factor BamE [Gammaproteobacteria bacterium]|nr:outer membrane protein assembly factor BamE [Gammaproteobacteria bacterium]